MVAERATRKPPTTARPAGSVTRLRIVRPGAAPFCADADDTAIAVSASPQPPPPGRCVGAPRRKWDAGADNGVSLPTTPESPRRYATPTKPVPLSCTNHPCTGGSCTDADSSVEAVGAKGHE